MNLNIKQILNLKTIRDIAKHCSWPDMDSVVEAIEEDIRETLTNPEHNRISTQTCKDYVQELIELYNKYHGDLRLILKTSDLVNYRLKIVNDHSVLDYSDRFVIPE